MQSARRLQVKLSMHLGPSRTSKSASNTAAVPHMRKYFKGMHPTPTMSLAPTGMGHRPLLLCNHCSTRSSVNHQRLNPSIPSPPCQGEKEEEAHVDVAMQL
ncbi:hypothetical protein B0H13DRAFT_2309682 [Mycena leptocephala]|nr:hypothetical protein B0H13DRAFT_2309682 [Mycena leptocephala]